VLIIDYYFIRKTELAVDQLYRDDGIYSYGWERLEHGRHRGLRRRRAAEYSGLPERCLPGAFPDVGAGFKTLYTYAWFVGIAIAAVVYGLMMKGRAVPAMARPPNY
jgi:NCS1 family nucleobase:cation symporter-1